MKTNHVKNNSEARAEQVTNTTVTNPQVEAIYLGVDLHKQSISITRILDHGTPQPAQRLSWDQFWRFVEKQVGLARKVHVVYEAGAFGFWVCRKLQKMGVDCLVCHPEKLDPQHKRVQTDRLDSRHLADKLQRYVLGNRKALVAVYVPSEAEEQQRLEARHRRHLSQELRRLRARGCGLLLSQGIFQTAHWWKPGVWEQLKGRLSPQLVAALEDDRVLIGQLEERLKTSEQRLAAQAPKELPVGFGRLTFVLLLHELCNYQRFHNRRGMAGFTGLCGAVSSSGPCHLDLSINKAGSGYLRTLLVELAWRMVYWQPGYKRLKGWEVLRQAGSSRQRRQRKIALVALARQLAVDLWRWQTGRVSPAELGWKMAAA